MKKLRVALIGYGRSGRDIHNHMFKQLTDKYEVTVGVEIDAQRRDMMHAELGIEHGSRADQPLPAGAWHDRAVRKARRARRGRL